MGVDVVWPDSCGRLAHLLCGDADFIVNDGEELPLVRLDRCLLLQVHGSGKYTGGALAIVRLGMPGISHRGAHVLPRVGSRPAVTSQDIIEVREHTLPNFFLEKRFCAHAQASRVLAKITNDIVVTSILAGEVLFVVNLRQALDEGWPVDSVMGFMH